MHQVDNMKYKLVIVLCLYLFGNTAQADVDLDLVGCWEATIPEFENNVATICLNYEVGSISYFYTNEGTDSEPTRCFQPAFINSEKESILLEGMGGFCKNGREQTEFTFRCWPTKTTKMECELYVGYSKLNTTQVERK